MRRKERTILTPAVFAGVLTATIDILCQWAECRERGEELTLQNLDWSRTLRNTAIMTVVGAGAGYFYYHYCVGRERDLPFDADRFLNHVLMSEHLRNDPRYLRKMLQYRDNTCSRLASLFDGMLVVYPEKAGSLYKRTAVLSDYDADIILAFKKCSYATLEEMNADAYEKIGREFRGEARIIRQRRSIGVVFEAGVDEFPIDIVPGREINDYRTDKQLNLYVNPAWFWQPGSRFKADIGQQRKITANQPAGRQVIKLLKIYRNRYVPGLPSLLIEQAVTDALSAARYDTDDSIAENLLNCMDWLARKLAQEKVRDLGNSNNDLNEKLGRSARFAASWLLQTDVARVEYNPRYLMEIFEYPFKKRIHSPSNNSGATIPEKIVLQFS
jgi:hypothetical protein